MFETPDWRKARRCHSAATSATAAEVDRHVLVRAVSDLVLQLGAASIPSMKTSAFALSIEIGFAVSETKQSFPRNLQILLRPFCSPRRQVRRRYASACITASRIASARGRGKGAQGSLTAVHAGRREPPGGTARGMPAHASIVWRPVRSGTRLRNGMRLFGFGNSRHSGAGQLMQRLCASA